MNPDITEKSTEDDKMQEKGFQISLNIMANIKASEILPLVTEKANLFSGNLKVSSSNIEKLQNVLQILQERKLTHKLDVTEITQEEFFGTILKVRTGSPALTKLEEEHLKKEMKAYAISVLLTSSNEFSGYYTLYYDDEETADTILEMQKNNSKLKFLNRKITIRPLEERTKNFKPRTNGFKARPKGFKGRAKGFKGRTKGFKNESLKRKRK